MPRLLDIDEWLPGLQGGTRRRAFAAATTLLVVLASHAMRETARDALFLSGLPATRLPWAYLAIAGLSLGAGLAGRPLLGAVSHRALLVATLLVGAAVDVVFWWISPGGASGGLFALYVWTGLVATAVTVQLWLHLADVFDVGEAKRAFPVVAAGGLGGALAGSALASVVVSFLPVRSLLLGASLLFALAALLTLRLQPRAGGEPEHAAVGSDGTEPLAAGLRSVLASPYLRRVMALATLTAVLGTGVDFAFKTAVAAEVPREQLGAFFARFSALVNGGALLFQLLAVPLLIQGIGVVRSVAILPALLLLGAGALAAFGGLVPALALRGSDVVLRHSLHRSGAEILYLPVEPALRATFKTVVDSLGQRGGQALASLGILLAIAWRGDAREIGLALLVLAALALLSLIGLRGDYVARFRAQLRALDPETRVAVPRLDLHSLEALVSALSSPHDADVLSALGLLEASGRTQLITPLILHHPSPVVVLRALELLAHSRHPHVDAAIEHLLSHRHPEVRAAALRAYAARAPGSAEVLRLLREDPSQAVRVAALVAWTGWQGDAGELERQVGAILEHGGREARVALARSLPSLPYALIAAPVRAVLACRDPVLHAELAKAAGGDLTPGRLPLLIALLARRESRCAARPVLLSLGDTALIALARAQRSADTPDAVRRQLARTLARLPSPAAVPPLLEALAGDDARMRYRALRALARLRTHDPTLPVPEEPLLRSLHASLERAVTLLYYRTVQALWDELHPLAPGPAADLLPSLLDEKIERALERAFLALHVHEPEHGYAVLFRALRHGGARRAGGREVLEHLVEGALREGMLAMVGGDDPLERLRGAARYFAPEGASLLLELLPRGDRVKDLSEEGCARLAELAREAFAAAQADPDPILASVARRRYGGPCAHGGGAGAGDGE